MVVPPVGALIRVLPPGYDAIWFRGERIFYFDGTFYRGNRHGPGYRVIPAPYGVEVPYLPAGSREVRRGGSRYYHARGVHYRPVRRSGVTFFLSVRL